MSMHVNDEQLYAMAFDQSLPEPVSAAHLATCAQCRAELEQLQLLAAEWAVARRSEPSSQVLANYARLFDQVQQQGSRLSQLWQTVVAALTWDGRQQPALQGVRSGGATSYRLLYATPQAEVELWVETEGLNRRVQGEVMQLGTAEPATPALVQLLDTADVALAEAEAQPDGRFRLDAIAPGAYSLLLSPAVGPAIAIPTLEIT